MSGCNMLHDDQMQKAFDYWRSRTEAERKLMGPETRICVSIIPDPLPATGYCPMPYEVVSVYEVLQWAGNKTAALMAHVTELEREKGKYRELALRFQWLLSTENFPSTLLESISNAVLERPHE